MNDYEETLILMNELWFWIYLQEIVSSALHEDNGYESFIGITSN